MARRRWMPVELKPIDPTPGYPAEDLAPMDAIAWGRRLVAQLYRWGAPLDGFRYDNFGFPISAEICRSVADVIELHLAELPPEEQQYWESLIPYWRHCGGFFQRGKREAVSYPLD